MILVDFAGMVLSCISVSLLGDWDINYWGLKESKSDEMIYNSRVDYSGGKECQRICCKLGEYALRTPTGI